MHACIVINGLEIRVADDAGGFIREKTLDPRLFGSLDEVLYDLAERVGRIRVAAIATDRTVNRVGSSLRFTQLDWPNFTPEVNWSSPVCGATAGVDSATCAASIIGTLSQESERVIWRGNGVGKRKLAVVLDSCVDARTVLVRPNHKTLLRTRPRAAMGNLLWQPWDELTRWLLMQKNAPRTYHEVLSLNVGLGRLVELVTMYPSPVRTEEEERLLRELTDRTVDLKLEYASLRVMELAKRGNRMAEGVMHLWAALCGQFLWQVSRTLLPHDGGSVYVTDQSIIGDAYLSKLVAEQTNLLSHFRGTTHGGDDNRFSLLFAGEPDKASVIAQGGIMLATQVRTP